MPPSEVDLGSLLAVLRYAQSVQDNVAVQLEAGLPDRVRDLLVHMELVAARN